MYMMSSLQSHDVDCNLMHACIILHELYALIVIKHMHER